MVGLLDSIEAEKIREVEWKEEVALGWNVMTLYPLVLMKCWECDEDWGVHSETMN